MENMDVQKSKHEKQSSVAATPTSVTSCRKKKNEEGTFLEDLKDHIDEFINASMEEHQTCFKKTIQKVCYCQLVNTYICIIVFSFTLKMMFVESFSDVWYVQDCRRKEL